MRLNRMLFNTVGTEPAWSERMLDLDKTAAELGIEEDDACNYTRVVIGELWEARTLKEWARGANTHEEQ